MDRIDDHSLNARVACVIGSRADAYGLERARSRGISAVFVARKEYSDTPSFSHAVWSEIRKHNVDLVVMAGFMCLLEIPGDFENRVVNVHPGLIPAFCGKGMYGHHVHEAVIAQKETESGISIHVVDEQYDHGPVIFQDRCPVLPADTPETLAAKIHALEHRHFPGVIESYIEKQNRS